MFNTKGYAIFCLVMAVLMVVCFGIHVQLNKPIWAIADFVLMVLNLNQAVNAYKTHRQHLAAVKRLLESVGQ